MRRSRILRTLTVACTVAGATFLAAPAANAAASACSHNWSGPQVCIAISGPDGSSYPGTITATWTNPPKSRHKATAYISTYAASVKVTAKRSGDAIKGSYNSYGTNFSNGALCARFKGSSVKACVDLHNR
ncbi:hypothetical protein [Streptomyces sp. NPDC101393]|uniref:hypothetical protein n=1 Tax=Streptomyces sp. NPDC101393 TaxID=3366141 RepID=UPI0038252562